MPAVCDPATGLQFYELSHEWGHGVPMMPGHEDVVLKRGAKHADYGVMSHRIRMVMHSGTHLNAPIHLVQHGAGVGGIALERCFGSGVILNLAKGKWETVTSADLEAATPAVQAGDIVVIHTGWHRRYSDSLEYFGDSPGLSRDAAEWLIARQVKLVAVDTPQIDHPLATSLGAHRGGPLMKRLVATYARETGRDATADYPEWMPAHRALLSAGIPTIENVGGDVAELAGSRATFQCYPWRWLEGDACVVRFVAMTDPTGKCRVDPGKAA